MGRGVTASSRPTPLTRFASQIDLSPMGRGEVSMLIHSKTTMLLVLVLVLVRRRRPQAEQGGERTAMAGVDGGIGAHARLQLADMSVIAVEIDSHRHPLHYLDEVAGGILRRQDRELRAGAGA